MGNDATCNASDQRGVARPQDGNADSNAACDMGAYERSAKSGRSDKVSLSLQDLVVPENIGTAKVRVKLDSASSKTVTVNYATKARTALPGKDFRGRIGTLTFKPGQTSKIISVPIINDKASEPTERFIIKLYAPVNAVIADATGAITIRDGD